MPKVVVSKQTSKPSQAAYLAVKDILSNDKELKKLDPSYESSFNDSSLSGTAQGKLFKANLAVKETSDGSEVEIIVELPFTLSLAKGIVQRTLQKKLDDTLTT